MRQVLIEFILSPALIGALITTGLCMVWRRQKRTPLWLALISAILATSGILLFAYGRLLFTSFFWQDPDDLITVIIFVPGAASLIVSIVAIHIYRYGKG
jgi:hypothetical protein